LRRSILACGLLLAFAGMTTAAAAAGKSGGAGTTTSGTTPTASTTTGATTSDTTARAEARAAAYWSRHIRSYRAGTRRWLAVVHGGPVSSSKRRTPAAHSVASLRLLARTWRHREHAAWWRAIHPPHLQAWMCIHRYEGSWTDSGGPYWGGLQMDLGFQATYGGWLLRHKGTADHWSPLEQIWVAVRAAHSRGFSPWPNTARFCGVY
jgi:hypothetical protein